MKKMNRRNFFETSITRTFALAGASMLPFPFSLASASDPGNPHFFLNIFINTGADLSYLIDARSLELTHSKTRANYLNEEPVELAFSNSKTLATRLFNPLLPYKEDFSVIQGVHMSSSFDGHEQNLNLLLTGNAFGGNSFLPHFNLKGSPLDAISNSRFLLGTFNNDSKIVPMSSSSMAAVKKSLLASANLSRRSVLYQALERNYLSAAFQNKGRISLGAQALAQALREQESLFTDFSTLQDLPPDTPETTAFLHSSFELLKKGATNTINLIIEPPAGKTFDTHSPSQAKETVPLLEGLVESLVEILKVLKETPFDTTRSFMDVTTFMIATEISRTNRGSGTDIFNTGTDHNSFNNTIILGGKGIAKNKVIGASDLHRKDEVLSGAHLQFDQSKNKIFGRPFDFSTQTTSSVLPDQYAAKDYITSASVINTLYKVFGVSASLHRKNGRDEYPAASVDSLILN